MQKGKERCGEIVQEMAEYFFKIFLGDFHSPLYIPPAFLSYILERKRMVATLRDCMGKTWSVKLQKDDYSMFFNEDGWRGFALSHSLESGDFLYFKYNGDLDFDIKIFGMTACEKTFLTTINVEEMAEKESEEEENFRLPQEVREEDHDHEPERSVFNVPRSRRAQCHDRVRIEKTPSPSKRVIFNARYISRPPPSQSSEMGRRCDTCSWKKRHFFKVLFGDFTQELRLPPAFTKYIEVKEDNGNATLRVCGGRTWQVELRKVDNRFVFRNGWSNFVIGIGLQTGDFLVFKHERVLHFFVRIFDKSACEKRQLPAGEACRNAERSNMSPSEGSPESIPSKHRRGRVADPKNDAWNAACSFKTKHPCFRKYLTDTMCAKAYHVHVPLAFAREHLMFESCTLMFSDPQDRCYPVGYVNKLEHGICRFRSGWRKFADENRLKEGDGCVFEFIKERKGFNVIIFRGIKDGAKGGR